MLVEEHPEKISILCSFSCSYDVRSYRIHDIEIIKKKKKKKKQNT